jgi:hypothetical protein
VAIIAPVGRPSGCVRLLTTLSALVVAAAVFVPAAAGVEAARGINACALLKVSEVRSVLGAPASLRRGATAANCVVRGGGLLPVVSVATSGGTSTFRRLIRASGAPTTKRVRGIGTEAVTYDYVSEEPLHRARGVIVRKGARVLQLSTSDVGISPPGLPTIQHLTALARIAVRRL